jgi:hypothetical protein
LILFLLYSLFLSLIFFEMCLVALFQHSSDIFHNWCFNLKKQR